jgi:F420H(2)-dependent quinone reductase
MGVQKSLMRAANLIPVKLFRMSNGRLMGKVGGMATLLLTVAGRKTGVEHTTLVGYFEDDGRYVVNGSATSGTLIGPWSKSGRHAPR